MYDVKGDNSVKKLIALTCILTIALGIAAGCGIWEEETPTDEATEIYQVN